MVVHQLYVKCCVSHWRYKHESKSYFLILRSLASSAKRHKVENHKLRLLVVEKGNDVIVLEAGEKIADQNLPTSIHTWSCSSVVRLCLWHQHASIVGPKDLEVVHHPSFSCLHPKSSPPSGTASFLWPTPFTSLKFRTCCLFPGL